MKPAPVILAMALGTAGGARSADWLYTLSGTPEAGQKIEAWQLSEEGRLEGPHLTWVTEHRGILVRSGDQAFIGEDRPSEAGRPSGGIQVAQLPAGGGSLIPGERFPGSGSTSCYLALHPEGRSIAATYFRHHGRFGGPGAQSRGSVDVLRLGDGKSVTLTSDASSLHPTRQTASHPHAAKFSPDGSLLAIADLGTDEVRFHDVDGSGLPAPEPSTVVKLPPRSGPRHLDFHPTRPVAYVNSEMTSRIFRLSRGESGWEISQETATHPGPGGAPADLKISPDGRWLATSIRSPNRIALHPLGQAGEISGPPRIAETNLEGVRWMVFSPDSKFLAVSNGGRELMVYEVPVSGDGELRERIRHPLPGLTGLTFSAPVRSVPETAR